MTADVMDKQYELAWSLSQWDSPLPSSDKSLNGLIFTTIRDLQDGAGDIARLSAEFRRRSALLLTDPALVRDGGTAALQQFLVGAAQSGVLCDAMDVNQGKTETATATGRWREWDTSRTEDFWSQEKLSALVGVVGETLLRVSSGERSSFVLGALRRARESCQFQYAEQLLRGAPKREAGDSRFTLEEARLMWDRGWRSEAISSLSAMVGGVDVGRAKPEVAAEAVLTLANWTVAEKARSARDTRQLYDRAIRTAARLAASSNRTELETRARFHLAQFADRVFREHLQRMQSSEWTEMTEDILRKAEQMARLSGAGDVQTRRRCQEMRHKSELLQSEQKMIETEAAELFDVALSSYALVLEKSREFDLAAMLRMCSLMFMLDTQQEKADDFIDKIASIPVC